MNTNLRRIHFYSWLLIVLIIPVILFFSIKDLKIERTENKLLKSGVSTTQNAIKITENELIKVWLYQDEIAVQVKSSVKSASTVIYTLNPDGKKDRVLGQITTSGNYRFKISEQPDGILLYDTLKQKLITKLTF